MSEKKGSKKAANSTPVVEPVITPETPQLETTQGIEAVTQPPVAEPVSEELPHAEPSEGSDVTESHEYTITEQDLENNPELQEQGFEVGEKIILGEVATPEEIILDFLGEKEGFVEINDILEEIVANPEDRAECKAVRITLMNMEAEGKIEVANKAHLSLDMPFYKGDDPKTRYHNLKTQPLFARLKSA
jgi:hypothetical protein